MKMNWTNSSFWWLLKSAKRTLSVSVLWFQTAVSSSSVLTLQVTGKAGIVNRGRRSVQVGKLNSKFAVAWLTYRKQLGLLGFYVG